ncbi:MAG: hypothetical protein UZ10_BCD003002273 [Bacteroidetes bacterium OLB10]|nr:MAG: hypothetical protein UZ10_BCD003002273 [Bacteroidetes bacterium OLB10]
MDLCAELWTDFDGRNGWVGGGQGVFCGLNDGGLFGEKFLQKRVKDQRGEVIEGKVVLCGFEKVVGQILFSEK